MSTLIILSSLLAIGLYIPLCIQILTGKANQNFATWMLWAVLDGVVAGTLIVQHGNYILPVAYTLGSAVTALCIIKSKNFQWTWFESLVVFLVLVSITVWALSGANIATVASTTAMLIAGLPQLVESYRKPWDTPILIYAGYFVANSLSVFGGKSWSIEERFYPVCAAIYCFAIVVISSRKLWLKKELNLCSEE